MYSIFSGVFGLPYRLASLLIPICFYRVILNGTPSGPRTKI